MKEPSRLLPFLPDYPSFFPILHDFFPDFWQFFCCQGWQSAPLDPPSGYATVNNIDCALMGYAILSNLSCEVHHLVCWYKYTCH